MLFEILSTYTSRFMFVAFHQEDPVPFIEFSSSASGGDWIPEGPHSSEWKPSDDKQYWLPPPMHYKKCIKDKLKKTKQQ